MHIAGAIMGTYGLTFAAVGLAYTGIDCVAETFRGNPQANAPDVYKFFCMLSMSCL